MFGGVTFVAPAGHHQIPLAEVGSQSGCASEAGRFGLIKILGDVGNACSPLINGSLRYKTGETVINYRVRDIKRRCGGIAVTAAGFVLAHLRDHPATQSGHFILHVRDCGHIILTVATPRLRNTTLLGQGTDGKVAYAKGEEIGRAHV